MNLYLYNGPVMIFDNCVADKWNGQTYAKSKTKAKSNLSYQFKKQNNLSSSALVKLPGELVEADDLYMKERKYG